MILNYEDIITMHFLTHDRQLKELLEINIKIPAEI